MCDIYYCRFSTPNFNENNCRRRLKQPYKRNYEISSFRLISDPKDGSYLTYIPILSPKREYVFNVIEIS